MRLGKKVAAIAVAGLAMAAASAPASAALTVSFPVGATSGFFGDSNIAPGTAYDESQPFFLTNSGAGTFSISSTSSLFNITAAYIDSNAFALTNIGGFDFGGLMESIGSGLHTLRVVGTATATAPSTGAYGGQITFTPGTTTAVPEPASWAMMIGGVGFAGGALRRRAKRDAKTVAFA